MVLIGILAVCAECATVLAQAADTIDPAVNARGDAIAAGVMQAWSTFRSGEWPRQGLK